MTEPAESAATRPGRAKGADDRRRLCALTRRELPADALIRFVAGPGGAIAPDVTGKLGGRGVWVTATAASVAKAANRNVFAKALKMNAKPDPRLADLVAVQLHERVRQALAFANKAGLVTTGFVKVEAAIERVDVAVLIAAADAADDGAERLARKYRAICEAKGRAFVISRTLTIADLSFAIGRPTVVHACLADGGQCRSFVRESLRFERYRSNEDTFAGVVGAGNAGAETATADAAIASSVSDGASVDDSMTREGGRELPAGAAPDGPRGVETDKA